jgi:two-component sensor histidine kinase
MNSIINNVLDISKISNSNLELEKRDFNFRDFINQIIEINSIQINEKGLKLLVDISVEIPEMITGDELRLSQILNNLFSNALKFTPYGQIGLEVTKMNQTDDTIELFFMMFDTGIGISPEEKDKLFRSFSQGDSSITRRFGGTGLGLSICKKLIEAMGGTIQVDSEKNVGSVFTFSVRLGLPRDALGLNASAFNKGQEDIIDRVIKQPESEPAERNNNVSEIEYIKMRLQNSNTKALPKVYGREAVKDVLADINNVLEKLVICIEMENWLKAEELITGIKKLVPQERTELSKTVFRLLLAIRKENHDSSLEILKELKEVMRKEE